MSKIEHTKFNLAARLASLLVLGALAACSLIPTSDASQPTSPPETETTATATLLLDNQAQFKFETFQPSQTFPEEFKPYASQFAQLAQEDGLDFEQMDEMLWISAAQGDQSVDYALLPLAIVSDLTDPDGQPSNPHLVYYIAYQNEQGQRVRGSRYERILLRC